MKRRIFATLFFAGLGIVGPARAQQAETPPRVSQPVYPAYNAEGAMPYASQYAETAEGYPAGGYPTEGDYAGYQQGYVDPNVQGAEGVAGVDQVANLSFDGDAAQGGPLNSAVSGSQNGCGQTSCCQPACCPSTCCEPFWAHRSSVFAEALFLKPRGADVANAQPQNGIGPTAVPFGAVSSNSPTYSPGFRLGATFALDRCSSIYAAYTYFQAESNGSQFVNPPLVEHSLVTLPQIGTAASDGLASLSRFNIRFQFADIDYRRLLMGGRNWYVNYAVGVRYANLQQLFRQTQVIGPTMTGVTSNVGLDAAGSRIGLLGARKAANRGAYIYGNAFADILVGNFRSSYAQANNLQGLQGANSWQNFRPVPILEYELGLGWVSPNGRWQFAGGYYFAAWFNCVTNSNYIQAVQTNNYVNASNAITFDGLVLRGQRLW
ncbi:MAG TPA: Lpg1974 family pore-forming outer membrane protein [Pirellulales bacterium]|nr:Lpg1974 family pore-forming outer membrane protein [Pirellulales bacterium]